MPPRGKAPGLKRGRHGLPYWIARQVVRDPMGFPDKCIALPPDADEETLSRLCFEHTARLMEWLNSDEASASADVRTSYDGTVLSACRLYQEHPLSRFHAVKHNTRRTYVDSLKILEQTVGRRLIRNVTVIDVQHWYDQWRKPARPDASERIDRAHDAVAMFRTVLWFCTALRIKEAKQLAEELRAVKFERRGAREQEMTYQHATAFIRTALDMGGKGVIPANRARNMAIGVAAQFELMLRQRDIIGEYQPASPPPRLPAGVAVIELGDELWSGYFAWEHIPGWRWRLKTSKSKYRAAADFDLTRYGLLLPLLESVPHGERQGPIVKGGGDLPVRRANYSKWFRRIARAAGIPDEVWSMDARAGGATEAEEAGADLEAIKTALTHTDERTTLRYIRRRASKIATVAEARAKKRASERDGGQ